MGMFDWVTVDPKHGVPDAEYQTKDLGCVMTTIRITGDGRLEVELFEYEEVPKKERPYPDDDGILGMVGSRRRINNRWVDLKHHGMFNFYGFTGPGFKGECLEYDAKFTDGVLVEIVPVNDNPSQAQTLMD